MPAAAEKTEIMRLPLPLINAIRFIPPFDFPLCLSAGSLFFIFPLISFKNPSFLLGLGQKEKAPVRMMWKVPFSMFH